MHGNKMYPGIRGALCIKFNLSAWIVSYYLAHSYRNLGEFHGFHFIINKSHGHVVGWGPSLPALAHFFLAYH
jgi:hypothetical protein